MVHAFAGIFWGVLVNDGESKPYPNVKDLAYAKVNLPNLPEWDWAFEQAVVHKQNFPVDTAALFD